MGVAAVLFGGCERREPETTQAIDAAPPDEPGASPALSRRDITVDDRSQWRTRILWPDECEAAFRASHVGNDGGMRIIRLGPAVSLVEVTCAAGSYQPSVRRFRLTEDSAGARAVPLTFTVYESEDGRELRVTSRTEVWGESVVTPASGEIAILSVARQTADCGVWARYSLAADEPRLLAAAARVECPVTPGPPVTISESGPPSGWDSVSRKD